MAGVTTFLAMTKRERKRSRIGAGRKGHDSRHAPHLAGDGRHGPLRRVLSRSARRATRSRVVDSRRLRTIREHRRHARDARAGRTVPARQHARSEEHTSELQSLMRISYAVFFLKKKK